MKDSNHSMNEEKIPEDQTSLQCGVSDVPIEMKSAFFSQMGLETKMA